MCLCAIKHSTHERTKSELVLRSSAARTLTHRRRKNSVVYLVHKSRKVAVHSEKKETPALWERELRPILLVQKELADRQKTSAGSVAFGFTLKPTTVLSTQRAVHTRIRVVINFWTIG